MKYTIKSGDTLSAIAKRYGVSVQAIQKANATLITNVNRIRAGWVINIPVPQSTTPTKDYSALGQAVDKCVDAVHNLPEFKEVLKLL